ncbi:MAG: secretin N-terminal domain-containing protein [Pseudomonadota bacterium]
MNPSIVLAVAVLVATAPFSANAESDQSEHIARPQLPTTELTKLLDSVGARLEKRFLIDRNVDAVIVVGTLSLDDVDYDDLLVIMRNNELAVVPADDALSVVPVDRVRQYGLPVVTDLSQPRPAEEWITYVHVLERTSPEWLIPILRPLLPQAGHMAAFPPSNAIIIADRHANVRRVVAVIESLDRNAVMEEN